MKIKKKNPTIGIGNGNEYLFPNIWEWEIAKFGTNWKFLNASSTLSTMLSLHICANSCLLFSLNKLSLFRVKFTQSTEKGCLETT